MSDVLRYRANNAWVSLWAEREIWQYLVIWVCGVWATARIWPTLNRQLRWFFVALPFLGIVSVPISYLLLEQLRWSLILQVRPAGELLFTVATASLACSIAGIRAALKRKGWEALLWFLLVFVLPVNARVLELLRVSNPRNAIQLAFCVAVAGLLALLLTQFGSTKVRRLVLLIPVLAIVAAPSIGR